MRSVRSFMLAAMCAAACTFAVTAPAAAQSGSSGAPSPRPSASSPIVKPPVAPGGICAPWHSCVAKGVLALAGLYALFLLLQFTIMRKGFDTLEHKQGHPQGIAVKKE